MEGKARTKTHRLCAMLQYEREGFDVIRTLLYKIATAIEVRAPHRVYTIDIDGKPYLHRYALGGIGRFFAYLHHFVGSDGDRHLHDHSFRAVCLILCGGYVEVRGIGQTVESYSAPAINVLGCNTPHQIISVTPDTWTIVFGWRRRKYWHFAEIANKQTMSSRWNWWKEKRDEH